MMKFGKILVLFVAFFMTTLSASASHGDSLKVETFSPRVNVKMSALAAIGIVNPAVEFRLDKKWSMQLEGMGVFAKRNFLGTGYPLQMGSFFVEGRYYFKKVFHGFFVAPNVGCGVFRMNKNILNKFFGWSPDLDYTKPANSVQAGTNAMAGLTLGYVHTFKKYPRWSVEINWSLGRQWAQYEDYFYEDNGNYVGYAPYSGSAEYMPFYRGGIFVAYKW